MIRWSSLALEEVMAIDGRYRPADPALADRMGRALTEAARFLVRHPFAGAPIDDSDRRKWVVRETPYIILYRYGRGLRILRVQHNPGKWRA
jgi:plasmid stabilization system protein ParE